MKLLFAALLCVSQVVAAAGLDPALQGKVNAKVKEIQTWAAEPTVVNAVKAYNAGKSPEAAAMDQAKWANTSVIDPFVRGLTKNPAAEVLKAKKGDVVSEAFLSGADGGKVAFLGKSSNWSHKGKPKHEQPLSGKTWQGDVEVDESSGLQQVQVAVPVLDGGKAIGSLVVGLSIGKLAK
ncbi:hypothetical protein [Steroidobacter sp.]|uniref:hypothetical protein n=1 Tax=Steroidobacter sp. TaxID=1978227 RepID=UPI001A3A6D7F|nr:hypothetical protein [Steroidobacter sp.]MBL8264922.1 hypothetical protein [Steroidobacter sp.]